ncbi:CPBP family intramembrane glutamic endopeptidase [Leuconostoc mesenteroides]
MIINRIVAIISRMIGQFIELVLVTVLIYLISSIPPIFIFMDQSNGWLVLISMIASVVISYFGYRYLTSKTTAIFERINLKKIGFIMIMLVLTNVLMDLIIPAIFGQNQDVSLNQQMIESMFQQGGVVALLFKLSTVIIAPIIEEIAFRGVIFEEAKPLGKVVQFIWPTLVFAAVHGPATPEQWTVYLTAGALLMIVRLVTKKLQYSVMFHMAHNLMATVGL